MAGGGEYFAACTLGVEPVLVDELRALGAADVRVARGGAHFRGDRGFGYACCLWLRSAIRVQEVIAVGSVESQDELYRFVAQLDWDRYLSVDRTLAVDASLRDSFLTHSKYAAQLVKDAIVDRFRRRTGRRPDVDTRRPDFPLRLLLRRRELILYRDLSGASLHKRGYRPVQVKSPLNEATAAGCLALTRWRREGALLDPMCGSGTFVIEAALAAADRAPGLGRTFPFERWPDFEPRTWRSLIHDARRRAEVGAGSVPPIEGADRHAGALGIAQRAAEQAGVAELVRLTHSPAIDLRPRTAPRVIVTNPPYGERLGEGSDLEQSWRDLGRLLHRSAGATAYVLSGDRRLTRFLGLRASRRWAVRNGPIDCRWIEYEIADL